MIVLTRKYTLKKNVSKQYQIRGLRLVTTLFGAKIEPFYKVP